MREEDVETAIKVVVVGNGAVGKSSMIQRYCKGIFTKDYKKTIGVDFLEKQISCDGEDVRLMLWDTAGQEEFDSITKSYYRGAQACVLAFSTVDRASFDAVSGWKEKVHSECGDIAMVLVQNKIDLVDDAVLTPDEAESLAKRLKLRFYRTSVKEDLNVAEVFQYLTERYIARKNAEDSTSVSQPQSQRTDMFQSPSGAGGTIGNINAKSSSKKGKNKNQTVSLEKPSVQRTHGKKKKFCFNV